MKKLLVSWWKSLPRPTGFHGDHYLGLLLVLGLSIGGIIKGIQTLNLAKRMTDAPPFLDSFSEPAIALAILKKHTKELITDYSQDLINIVFNTDPPACLVQSTQSTQYRAPQQTGPLEKIPHPIPSLSQSKLAAWCARLRTELKQQRSLLTEGDLGHELLLLYKKLGQWESFLDCYVEILGVSPEHPDVYGWARLALLHAGDYDRREEILDALQHIIRFSHNPVVVVRIKSAVDRWREENYAHEMAKVP